MLRFYAKILLWVASGDAVNVARCWARAVVRIQKRCCQGVHWHIGGYRDGNITRQAYDAARGEGLLLDLLLGGFPGADAPSIGTDKTTWSRKSEGAGGN